MIVAKLWFAAWFLVFYDKNAILSKEAGSTRFQNLQERFGNILRIAPLPKMTNTAKFPFKQKCLQLKFKVTYAFTGTLM